MKQRLSLELAPHSGVAEMGEQTVAMGTPPQREILWLDMADVQACKEQARSTFDPTALQELADSMRVHGLLQPILVRRLRRSAENTAPRHELVAGERRWRAGKLLGWKHIPAFISDYDVAAATEVSLIENLQRDDLSALEAGKALKRLGDHHRDSYAGLAKRVGKSKGWVEDRLRIANTSRDLQEMVARRPDTLTHVRELERVVDPKQLKALIQEVEGKQTVAGLRRRIKELDNSAQDDETSAEEATSADNTPVETMTGHDNKDEEAVTDVPASLADDSDTLDAMMGSLAPPLAASMVASDVEVAALPAPASVQPQETIRGNAHHAGDTQCYEDLLGDVRDLQRAVMRLPKPPTEELQQRITAELYDLMEIIYKAEDRWKAAA